MKKQKLLSVLLLAIFAVGIVSMAVPVGATITGKPTIVLPNYVVPGGSIWVWIEDFSATGGSTYFWLSEDNDAEVSSGDIKIAKESTDDVEAAMAEEGMTIKIPATVDPGEYWLKVSEDDDVGDAALPSRVIDNLDTYVPIAGLPAGWDGLDQIEVLAEEDWPTITVDPESGTVWKPYPDNDFREIDVEGEDIDTDYDGTGAAELFWDSYSWTDDALTDYEGIMEDDDGYMDFDVTDGEFEAEDVVLPEAFMGAHDILVLLWNSGDEEYLGTYGTFTVEPSVDVEFEGVLMPSQFSVEAEEWVVGQDVTIYAHGFPEGTIDADAPPEFIVRDIVTGEDVVVESEIAADQDVEDVPPGTFGVGTGGPNGDRLGLDATVYDVPEGVIDLRFEVNGEAFTVENALLSSTDSAADEMLGMVSPTSGEIGDDVWFYVIDYPADHAVDIVFSGPDVERSLVTDYGLTAPYNETDVNGAWMYRFTLQPLAGGTYDIKAYDLTEDPDEWEKIGEFEILPTVTIYDWTALPTLDDITSAFVEDRIFILGDGFLDESEFDTIVIGGEEIEFDDPVTVGDDGVFDSRDGFTADYFEVPHISGGGLDVAVEIKGEDGEGDPLTVETSITIDPRIQDISVADETGILALDYDGDWMDPTVAANDIFGGNPMKLTGMGFLAGESVTITCIDEDEDVEEVAEITDGGTADSDGDLEVVFMLPHTLDFARGLLELDIEVAGKTDTNKDSTYDRFTAYIVVDRVDDTAAKLFFGLEDDGDLDTEVQVGDEVRIVGIGFEERDLTLEIEGDEIKDVETENGFFDDTITIPELPRGEDLYTVDTLTATPTISSTYFSVMSKVVLSPSKAMPGATVTAYGTGFEEDEETDIIWPGLPTLVTAEGDEDGSWEETFTVPDVEPGTYTITFDAEFLPDTTPWDDPELTFYVLGPLKIVSLSMPGTVYPGSTIVISVNVRDYFDAAVEGATVTGTVDTASLTFTETIAGIYDATYTVPEDATEGTYTVAVTASKPEAGGDATASGTFYVEVKVPPEIPPPVDISPLEEAVSDLSSDVAGLSGDLSSLASDVAGLKSDIAALEEAIAAIPVVPVEWIYITAIMAVIAAIAAIAAVVAVYRKIA